MLHRCRIPYERRIPAARVVDHPRIPGYVYVTTCGGSRGAMSVGAFWDDHRITPDTEVDGVRVWQE